jgi:hypothetical protein
MNVIGWLVTEFGSEPFADVDALARAAARHVRLRASSRVPIIVNARGDARLRLRGEIIQAIAKYLF